MAMTDFHVPLIIRGEIIDDKDLIFGGRHGGASFTTPDLRKHLDKLTLSSPSALADLYALTFDDIVQYMSDLSDRMTLSQNAYLQNAFEMSCATNGMTEDILRRIYEQMHRIFSPAAIRQTVQAIGIPYLDGWVTEKLANGGTASVRAFGARAVHVIAGNVPSVAAMSMMQSIVTRSDIIVKTPSNDPLTAAAVARTAIDMAPDHPITKHMSVAYWKGGDTEVEEHLYRPDNVEKIIAWGGFASITHISKYIQPGIDLITLDPKLSSSMIGSEAFDSEAGMKEAARRLAIDVGARNQEACHSARVIYIETGVNEAGLKAANTFGQMVYDQIQALPTFVSAAARDPNQELMEEVSTLKLMRGEHKVFGGGRAGAVIVSQTSDPVDFARILGDRVANLVPVETLDTAVNAVSAYTQTIGIYPDSKRMELRDRLAFHGAQRTVSLGYAGHFANIGPHDGIEPLRRMCKWIVDEQYEPDTVPLATMV
jgi:hypothetical protein